MKTTKIIVHEKERDSEETKYICGNCFALVEFEDCYCWDCGSNIEDQTGASDYEDLKKFNEQEKEE